ncbi:MAG TPA: NUDIX hydrolase [Kofleriaceae bacterium]
MTGAVVEPRPAATVVLFREVGGGPALEVYLVRRHARSGFMASAYVFPGGAAEPGEDDLRVAGVRELEEECGVVLAPGDLHYFSHWVTPSIEKRRFTARFYAALLPAGQTPAFDNQETVDEAWVTPAAGLARAGELRLPPPQIRTLLDLEPAAAEGWDAVVAFCAERAAISHPILPRPCPSAGGITLLLPWDPDYAARGMGEAIEMPAGHPLGSGPSRFVLEEGAWIHVHAPSSPGAG